MQIILFLFSCGIKKEYEERGAISDFYDKNFIKDSPFNLNAFPNSIWFDFKFQSDLDFKQDRDKIRG